MYGTNSDASSYPKMSTASGHAHGHCQGKNDSCCNEGEAKVDFPSPGPADRPKPPPPPAHSKPDTTTMSIVQAVQYGEMEKLKELIDKGADVRAPDSENVTLLHWAAINNRVEIVKYVLF